MGKIGRMRYKRNKCSLFVGKPEENRPLGRPRDEWWMII
jgi:hypothetical protein